MSTHLAARIVNTEVRVSGRHKACRWMALRSIGKTAAVHIRRGDVYAADRDYFSGNEIKLTRGSGERLDCLDSN